jgi:aspartate aminotransferase
MNNYRFSKLAAGLGGLSISGIAERVNERIKQGENIYNLTIGDFDPQQFSIPEGLEEEIIRAYREKHTNYPRVGGIEPLLVEIAKHIKNYGGFLYQTDEILVGSGARPLIYLFFRAVIDPGDKIIYPVPSWNNYNYVELAAAKSVPIATRVENNFLLTASELEPHIQDAALIVLNSPANPTGTTFAKKELTAIVDLVVAENKRRIASKQKPLYLMFDMIYWLLTYGAAKHYNPLELNPEIRDYIVLIDGITKCFAATGVRVGWALGPKDLIAKMRLMLAHTGAWAPKPEQVAAARFLADSAQIEKYLIHFKHELFNRLDIFYQAFLKLEQAGYKITVLKPQGAFYVVFKLDLIGKKTAAGKVLNTTDDINDYILSEAKVALVPFYAFGAADDLPWFRLSVGSCSVENAKLAAKAIGEAVINCQ